LVVLQLTKKLIIITPWVQSLFAAFLLHSFIGYTNTDEEGQELLQPALASLDEFNFVAVGDWGCTANSESTLANVVSKNPELVLGLGDYSYATNADCWLKIIEPINDKMKIAIGNHEHTIYQYTYGNGSYRSPTLLNEYLRHFNLTKQYYSFDYGNIHFLVASSEIPFDTSSEQYGFIKNDLATASTNSSLKWIVVNFHNPIYASPNQQLPNTSFRDIYHPLFDTYGVDLVLQGHIHNYQRSYPLKYNPSSPSHPLVTTQEQTNYSEPEGQIFVTIGTGGQSLYDLEHKSSFIVSQTAESYGLLNIDMTNDGLSLNASFFSNQDNDGTVKDNFIINKSPYSYKPYLELNGSSYVEIANNIPLQLTKFTVSAWFNSNDSITEDSISNRFIITKGEVGEDTSGNNLNYGLWMTSNGKLIAGFETSNGTDVFISSPQSYNDSNWHYSTITYDGSSLRLYTDGVQVANKSTTNLTPDTSGKQPLRVGANALLMERYFSGSVDEIGIWNRPLTASELRDAYSSGLINTSGQVLYLPFGNSSTVLIE
jgi:hypothetical protein